MEEWNFEGPVSVVRFPYITKSPNSDINRDLQTMAQAFTGLRQSLMLDSDVNNLSQTTHQEVSGT